MTDEVKKGRRILLWILGSSLVISLAVSALRVSVKGTERLSTDFVRFLLTVSLLTWL